LFFTPIRGILGVTIKRRQVKQMHGLDQSQALTKAAQRLSAARATGDPNIIAVEHKAYREALQKYTDPFKVKHAW
jgi:hypothetical protein